MTEELSPKTERIVAARQRLRERCEARLQATPALADEAPQGTGPANRHGMPRLPPGQHEAKGWPVLDLGIKPQIALEDFRLELAGACSAPQTLDFAGLSALPVVEDQSDFHCVTTWSKYDLRWRGVRFIDVASLAQPADEATHVFVSASDGYTTNLPLVEALKGDVLLAFEVEGEPLAREHGGPVRMITPQLYAWKGAKWISKIEFLTADRRGFWEERGYSNTAHPWREDRYAK
ncbi:MAG: molybdopterin-dependent oxidoreductase [Myxococcota bacterium]